jgi:hypothetical protein
MREAVPGETEEDAGDPGKDSIAEIANTVKETLASLAQKLVGFQQFKKDFPPACLAVKKAPKPEKILGELEGEDIEHEAEEEEAEVEDEGAPEEGAEIKEGDGKVEGEGE